jgi:hypothetical protein
VNWLQYLMRSLALIPIIVNGIEAIHGKSKDGATKKQLAMDAVGLASGVAENVDPEHKEVVAIAADVISKAIDGTVAVMNTAKGLQSPAPVAPHEEPLYLDHPTI